MAGCDAGVRGNPRIAGGTTAVPPAAHPVSGGPGLDFRFGWLVGSLPPAPARILDAGCGEGALSVWLAGRGYQVTAIDTDPAAVAVARSAGVPAVYADLAYYHDDPFDAVVMLLSLHHMHPLAAVMDRVAQLLRPGGRLILDEFAWDWAGQATIRWFYDIVAILAAAGVTGNLADGDDLAARWRKEHTKGGVLCNRGDAVIGAVSARFGDVTVRPVPYLARHLVDERANPKIFAALQRIEREHIADGTLSATGFQLTATRKPN